MTSALGVRRARRAAGPGRTRTWASAWATVAARPEGAIPEREARTGPWWIPLPVTIGPR